MSRFITSAITKKWDDPSKFTIAISPKGRESRKRLGHISDMDFTIAALSIQLPEFNSTPIEQYIAEEWRFSSGRLENLQVQITFKDYDNLKLYRTFLHAIQRFVKEYPSGQRFDITVATADDYTPDKFKDVVTFKDCILASVGGPTLDHSANASVATFSIVAKAKYAKRK